MRQETIKIQVLNDTKLCVLPVLPDLKTIVPIDSIDNLTVSWGIHGHETVQAAITKEKGYIVLPISATMPLGVYSVHMQGLINGQQWSDNRYEMFELTKYGNGIRYDQYYTTTVILGLPDEVLAQLKEEYAQKIAEYQRLIDELNRGEVATKSDLGLAPGETVAGLIKAGGGGGLTPEQWDEIAKQETLDALKGVAGTALKSMTFSTLQGETIEAAYVGSEGLHHKFTYGSWFPKKNVYVAMNQFGVGAAVTNGSVGIGLVDSITYTRSANTDDVDGINVKLDTIIANTSLTAQQADEDWQNVQPITE